MSREVVEVETGRAPTASVIWLHGLGADGHDFEPIVPELVAPGERALRFLFPHAPVRHVTLNGGYAMRASRALVDALIARENARGIASERIVLAGFSQGGAMALFAGTRYPQRLAGIMGLSCYLVLAGQLAAERVAANQATPIFLAHGSEDPVVAPPLGEQARRTLTEYGYGVEWHSYRMPHSVCPQEVADIAAWLRRVL